jgi:hypothetical protein
MFLCYTYGIVSTYVRIVFISHARWRASFIGNDDSFGLGSDLTESPVLFQVPLRFLNDPNIQNFK